MPPTEAPTVSAQPWLSILLPVYNVEPYLDECLDSVLSQAGEGVEVIALDDCSTDGSPAVLARRLDAHRGPAAFRVMRHERNGGLSAARNTLLAAARGQYIWFVDSDDYLAPGAVAELHAIVTRHHPDLVLCDYRIQRPRMTLKHRLRGELHRVTFAGASEQLVRDRDELIRGLFMAGQMFAWAKIFRRDIWPADAPLFEPGRYFEDAHAMPLLALRAQSHYHARRPWVVYRHRPGSILRTMDARKCADLADAFGDFAERCRADGVQLSHAARFAVAHQSAKNFIAACRHLSTIETGWFDQCAERFRSEFQNSAMLSPGMLILFYLTRGWPWRAIRLAVWLKNPTIVGSVLGRIRRARIF